MNTSLPPVAATIPCMAEIDTTVAPMTIAEFQDLIRERYHATDAARGVAPTFLWFAEEFGELAEALAKQARGDGDPDNLAEEFADVLAWLATLANVTDVDLTKAIHRKYIADGGPGGTK
jgi:NTP pyrophosphatase (non-canonical NTP hydrolase)